MSAEARLDSSVVEHSASASGSVVNTADASDGELSSKASLDMRSKPGGESVSSHFSHGSAGKHTHTHVHHESSSHKHHHRHHGAAVNASLETTETGTVEEMGTDIVDEEEKGPPPAEVSFEEAEARAKLTKSRKQNAFEVDASYTFGQMEYDLEEDGFRTELACTACGMASEAYPCGKCYTTKYCSRRCQQDDFPRHKLICAMRPKAEIEELKRAERNREEIAVEKEKARKVAIAEEKERKRQEAEDNAMFEEWEEAGRALVGPDEEEDLETGEIHVRYIPWKERQIKKLYALFFPKQAKIAAEKKKNFQDKIDKRRKYVKERGEELKRRDANSKHGPYCFCGCRAL